ncbi:PEP-CTERM sorting domain-containing protein, partial [Akkermansiaceae bacterium]|nr:PEP-CTERM sorting domain-containing protein [Akkermansiaceae bacterium]
LSLAMLLAPAVNGAVIFNDSFDDGGFTNGADATDTAWHGTTGNSAIEIFGGDLSLRSGTSGRGLHAEFSTQSLSTIGDKITATFNFTTPATIATVAKGGAFRIGLFNSNGETIHTQDGNSSSDAAWNNVLGNMVDLDVNTAGSENFQFREKPIGLVGDRLLGTTSGFVSQGSGGEAINYVFAASTAYTGTYSIEMTGASEWMIRSSLDDGAISDFEIRTVTSLNTSSYDILAFHVNSATFGSTNAGGDADNGIDLQSVSVEFDGVPEPSSALLSLIGGLMCFKRRRA